MSNTTWTRLPAITAHHGGCLNCPPVTSTLPPTAIIAVGFGCAMLTKGSEVIHQEDPDADAFMTCAQAESLAVQDPDHDWRITLHGPLRGRTYQRQGPAEWALVEQNEGFA